MASHIEFIGVPGSGKTTMYHKLVVLLNKEGIKARTFNKALFLCCIRSILSRKSFKDFLKVLLYFIGNIFFRSVSKFSNVQIDAYNEFLLANSTLIDFIAKVVNNKKIDLKEKLLIMKWFFNEFSGYQLISRYLRKDEILVFDEGFCHRAIAIWGRNESSKIEKDELDIYLNLIPLPDVILIINSEVEECERRLSERKYPPILKDLNYEERIGKLRFIEKLVPYITYIIEKKGTKLLYINNCKKSKPSFPTDAINAVKKIISDSDDYF
ncbi:MAG: hypothetical protein PHG41_00955 [Actinomycetota bacterium]|nr:hypothetical protein [Actinomycetota bacterium]